NAIGRCHRSAVGRAAPHAFTRYVKLPRPGTPLDAHRGDRLPLPLGARDEPADANIRTGRRLFVRGLEPVPGHEEGQHDGEHGARQLHGARRRARAAKSPAITSTSGKAPTVITRQRSRLACVETLKPRDTGRRVAMRARFSSSARVATAFTSRWSAR